jgi:hypothetical protein
VISFVHPQGGTTRSRQSEIRVGDEPTEPAVRRPTSLSSLGLTCSNDPVRPPTVTKEDRVAEKYSGEAYCVKCKAKREFEGEVVVNDKGTKMAKGKCHVCGTTLNRILGKA